MKPRTQIHPHLLDFIEDLRLYSNNTFKTADAITYVQSKFSAAGQEVPYDQQVASSLYHMASKKVVIELTAEPNTFRILGPTDIGPASRIDQLAVPTRSMISLQDILKDFLKIQGTLSFHIDTAYTYAYDRRPSTSPGTTRTALSKLVKLGLLERVAPGVFQAVSLSKINLSKIPYESPQADQAGVPYSKDETILVKKGVDKALLKAFDAFMHLIFAYIAEQSEYTQSVEQSMTHWMEEARKGIRVGARLIKVFEGG
jgi:hypothetical protein